SAPFPGIGTKRSIDSHFNDTGGVSATRSSGDTSTMRRPHHFATESRNPAKSPRGSTNSAISSGKGLVQRRTSSPSCARDACPSCGDNPYGLMI
ncbi:unnamed protein product, partial [Laminaria digitata]